MSTRFFLRARAQDMKGLLDMLGDAVNWGTAKKKAKANAELARLRVESEKLKQVAAARAARRAAANAHWLQQLHALPAAPRTKVVRR